VLAGGGALIVSFSLSNAVAQDSGARRSRRRQALPQLEDFAVP